MRRRLDAREQMSAMPGPHVGDHMPLVLVLAVSFLFILTACGGSSATTPTAAPKATSAPPASPAAAAAAVPSPASAPAASPVSAASPAAAAAAAPSSGVRITLVAGSEARYRAKEQLARQPLPNEAVGRTRDVTGTIVLNGTGAIDPAESTIQVDLRTLRSDQTQRDNWIQRNTLQTAQFPMAHLEVKEVAGMPWPLPAEGSASFELLGDLTVHGVTQPTTWQVTAELSPDGVTANAVAEMEISDFNMQPPRVGPVVSIEDRIHIEIDVVATRA